MIIDALARYAAEDPRSLAFVAGAQQMTYAELWRGVGAMESKIKQSAVPRGARVGVAIPDLRLAWLAILALEKLGCPAFAVPANIPPGAMGLANTAAILCQGPAQAADGTPSVDVSGALTLPPAAGLGAAADRPEQERFILLSAVTTGRFKRVQFANALRDARIRQTIAQQGFGPAMRLFLGAWGPWTDIGYFHALAAWSAGGVVIVHQQPGAALALAGVKAAAAVATPGMMDAWLRELGAQRIAAKGLRLTLKAPVSPAMLVAVQEGFQGAELYLEMGAPECGVAARSRIESVDDMRALAITAECEIVTPDGSQVPEGQMGAIRWRTDSTPRGYLDDQIASAVFFREGWFYPGTMGVLQNGRLAVTGRYAEVVDMRGDMIAPADVEAPLRTALNAGDVAVIAKPVVGQLDELHVFVVEGGPVTQEIAAAALKPFQGAFSKIRLHKSDVIPRNTAGKILYGSLRPLAKG